VVEDQQSVSALVEQWRALRTQCQNDVDAADRGAFDAIAERYGEQITRIERLIADTDPKTVDEVAAMLDVVVDSLEMEAMEPDHPPLKMVRKVRSNIRLIVGRSH
jgi:hypothetical protein